MRRHYFLRVEVVDAGRPETLLEGTADIVGVGSIRLMGVVDEILDDMELLDAFIGLLADDEEEVSSELTFFDACPSSVFLHLEAKFNEHKVSPRLYIAGLILTTIRTWQIYGDEVSEH